MPELPIELPTAWGQLSGTLLLPDAGGPFTAALLVAGSGPTDRDGNNPLLPAPIDNLKRLAQALAARGIATLRYDKRGIGASRFPGVSEAALRFEHLVDDAVQLGLLLQEHPAVARVVLVGHSEGALVAALAAEDAGARALVSVSGAGSRASVLMRRQVEAQLPDDLSQPALAALAALEQQQAVDDVPDALALLFRPTVQPYLMSWFRHDPPAVLSSVAVPVLLVHGSADAQVTVDHASLLHAGRPDARLQVLEGVDHLLAWQGDIGRGTEAVAAEVAGWLQALEEKAVPA
ncbi:alpha/beta hydrolase [Ramlibacter pallidus]|uniref:Alpha/beta hydrolase n=1 Tax=Ramlibacter pallidus TaxID=2780087 RepID=A0ABR9S8T5_9BURK|nr:alpha/beta hydrolase [Ramlibacter pallidus]MBE7369943.1 alpha/beta hydrolase [Ramlibacter pallidus]